MPYQFKKFIYGLKQAPREWYSKLSRSLPSLRLIKSDYELEVYFKPAKNFHILVGVLVDDDLDRICFSSLLCVDFMQ